MKLFLLVLFVSVPARADLICGFYQAEDFGDRVVYSITKFSDQKNYRGQTIFTITNPGNALVRNLLRGMCYCVTGNAQEDPEFLGDESYRLLTVTGVESRPYVGCTENRVP